MSRASDRGYYFLRVSVNGRSRYYFTYYDDLSVSYIRLLKLTRKHRTKLIPTNFINST